jgi:hypothetical protein
MVWLCSHEEGRDPREGYTLEEEMKSLVESRGHVLKYHSGDPVRARRFVV